MNASDEACDACVRVGGWALGLSRTELLNVVLDDRRVHDMPRGLEHRGFRRAAESLEGDRAHEAILAASRELLVGVDLGAVDRCGLERDAVF